jgi:glutathione synthase/RimK-type ligase-like ATP-grasp enzyme
MMPKITKCIIFNAGAETRQAFVSGLGELPYECYHTKHLMLHIKKGVQPVFLHKNVPIDWTGAFIFTRLCATDQQFVGILYDYLRRTGIPANDSINRSYVDTAKKISQMLLLSESDVSVPETFIFREESFERNKDHLKANISFPCVFKTDGSKGNNVHYVSSWQELEEQVKRKKPHVLCLVQPFLENEYDTRTLVAYGEVLGAIRRTRARGHLNNVTQGAVPSLHELTEKESSLALCAAEVCRVDIAGVDMINTPDGTLVIEVNKSPQVKGFESVHKFKVFERVAELMRKRYEGPLQN